MVTGPAQASQAVHFEAPTAILLDLNALTLHHVALVAKPQGAWTIVVPQVRVEPLTFQVAPPDAREVIALV
eukprot:CAMPEP_0179063740 /NCGR_PEP_ID=MMETSP0796-20121207/27593_1 /TAXON_ID=73915 /ORGANISM="Pyrodinium bahamense, Strain pbaha01" /LENGTH=70 /DNA_ID=CAMNT_0020760675 /DNA_START=160 /DNA_END=372 /DNA_ORIENTATION=+